MNLVALNIESIPLGQPLPFILRGADGALLAQKGFVIRNRDGFYTNNGDLPVQPNEFDNLFKLVRAKHVKTDVHWTKTWQPAVLTDYERYGWQNWQFRTM